MESVCNLKQVLQPCIANAPHRCRWWPRIASGLGTRHVSDYHIHLNTISTTYSGYLVARGTCAGCRTWIRSSLHRCTASKPMMYADGPVFPPLADNDQSRSIPHAAASRSILSRPATVFGMKLVLTASMSLHSTATAHKTLNFIVRFLGLRLGIGISHHVGCTVSSTGKRRPDTAVYSLCCRAFVHPWASTLKSRWWCFPVPHPQYMQESSSCSTSKDSKPVDCLQPVNKVGSNVFAKCSNQVPEGMVAGVERRYNGSYAMSCIGLISAIYMRRSCCD